MFKVNDKCVVELRKVGDTMTGAWYRDRDENQFYIDGKPSALKGLKKFNEKYMNSDPDFGYRKVELTIKDYYRYWDGWKTYEEMVEIFPDFVDRRFIAHKVRISE